MLAALLCEWLRHALMRGGLLLRPGSWRASCQDSSKGREDKAPVADGVRHLTNGGCRGASAALGFTRARAAAASDRVRQPYVCRASVAHSRPGAWELTFSSGLQGPLS